jgi:hypothetical protein
MKNTKHYNCLACPQCSNPLHDPLIELENNYAIKTVKCENCDFIGFRKGWELLNKEQENAHRELCRAGQISKIEIPANKRTPAYQR